MIIVIAVVLFLLFSTIHTIYKLKSGEYKAEKSVIARLFFALGLFGLIGSIIGGWLLVLSFLLKFDCTGCGGLGFLLFYGSIALIPINIVSEIIIMFSTVNKKKSKVETW